MSSDIKNTFEFFKRQGEDMLRRLQQVRQSQYSQLPEISHDLLSKGVSLVAERLFDSSQVGRLTRKIAKSSLKQQQREQERILEKSFEDEFSRWFTSIRAFIGTISVETRNIQQPNSEKLILKLNRQLDYVTIETRIRHILSFISQLLNEKLICNREIPSRPSKKRFELLVEPSTPFSSQQPVKEILANVQGYVKVVDPWVDEYTLDILLNVPKDVPIMLLTENIGGDETARSFIRSCKRFMVERPRFQIRKCDKGLLHDRYVIGQNKAYNIGSSLKDLGKRLSSINEITETKPAVEEQFNRIWAMSNKLL